ncbi:MAG: tryptophan synthase subunit beta [Bacteroidetes bacterium]|nr:tryptophan synthase subunit beta [Rhodothermia bacterium]MCS7155038.1 tryptophan synthase subunit beta [Bacteroidota bacterium]MCX7907322.1 tryptophan synthase subunit beta [Bacteroidota bacterium]MDW8137951.1 tryptophan synthase subunit beta [Bacteroidota bacterium]MDW8286197.1 tryptophan synthase subunit beta [Bacteroidota bacterium]
MEPVQAVLAPQPDARGRFGPYGGRFVPETLMPALEELEAAYREARQDPAFWQAYRSLLAEYVGRPTPLTYAERLSAHFGRGRIYLKREDLCHTGAHKINNALGQVLLALRMGKRRILAETGAGQHGVATATACARFGLECVVYMGALDMRRQRLNVERMRLLGAEVRAVSTGTGTLKDAINEAIRDWVTNVRTTFYVIGSVVGPHPYPLLVRDFQRIIGDEVRDQLLAREGRLPTHLVACVGGGSNAIGLFYPFLAEPSVRLYGVEAAGLGLDTDKTAATLSRGRPGVLHGAYTYALQTPDGQIQPAYSLSAGLDYPGVGPEHSYLRDVGRVRYEAVTDAEALEGVRLLTRLEGILPALETAHAVAFLRKLMPETSPEDLIVLNCSGRGDKDMTTLMEASGGDKEPAHA